MLFLHQADTYEIALKSLGSSILPYDLEGYPLHDLLLIGVGTDGHVGSIYPNTADASNKRIVVPVTDKQVKISLSLTSMMKAKRSVVACAGKSVKAPLGKAEAMVNSFLVSIPYLIIDMYCFFLFFSFNVQVRCLESEAETASSFPASVLRHKATWLIDEDSAALLKCRKK